MESVHVTTLTVADSRLRIISISGKPPGGESGENGGTSLNHISRQCRTGKEDASFHNQPYALKPSRYSLTSTDQGVVLRGRRTPRAGTFNKRLNGLVVTYSSNLAMLSMQEFIGSHMASKNSARELYF